MNAFPDNSLRDPIVVHPQKIRLNKKLKVETPPVLL